MLIVIEIALLLLFSYGILRMPPRYPWIVGVAFGCSLILFTNFFPVASFPLTPFFSLLPASIFFGSESIGTVESPLLKHAVLMNLTFFGVIFGLISQKKKQLQRTSVLLALAPIGIVVLLFLLAVIHMTTST